MCLSTELGTASIVEAEVGRGRSDGARLLAAAAVAAAAPRSRQYRYGAPACTNIHRARCER